MFYEKANARIGIAFSKDLRQKGIYLSDGENDCVPIINRESLEVLTSFSERERRCESYGVHSTATNSKVKILPPKPIADRPLGSFYTRDCVPVT